MNPRGVVRGFAPRVFGTPFVLLAVSAAIGPVGLGSALAQSIPSGASLPIHSPTGQELRRETAPASAAPASPKVSVRDNGSVRQSACPAAIAESPLTVALKDIEFVAPGGGALPPEIGRLLTPIANRFTGPSQSIRLVCDVRNAANAVLAAHNYVAAVRVPNQTIESGKLTLEVVTAHIVEIRVLGDAGASRHRIEALFDKLRALNPLNTRDAERILLLAGDTPGLKVLLQLSPAASGVPGDVTGDITIERSRGSLLLNVQDYGSQQIGRFAGLARAEIYGLTGLGDRTYVSAFSTTDTHEQQVIQAGHDFLVTGTGLRLGGSATYAWTKPDLSALGGDVDLKSRALLANLEASYPLVRSIGANATVAGGFDLINQTVKSSGTKINVDRMRILYLRANGDIAERAPAGLAPRWHFGGSLELRKGTGLLDASKTGQSIGGAFTTRFEGDPQAFELRGEFQTELRARFGPSQTYAITAAVDARGQYSNHPLLAFEEMAVGNLTIGRGYDPGATSGDRALGASFELRAGKPLPSDSKDVAFEAFGFFDAVRIWNLDTGSTENDRALRSVGGGFRVSWGDHARLDVAYAHPLDRALSFDTHNSPGRLLVSLVFRALPWRM